MVDTRMVTDLDGAMRAFDMLGLEGPREVERAFRAIAQRNAGLSGSRAPGRMYGTVSVHDLSIPGEDIIALAYGPRDIEQFPERDADGDNKRVAWWTDHGTDHQRAQRWFKKTPKSERTIAIANALTSASRRAGFDMGVV